MSAAAGPDIIEDGLVLCLDAANRQSYAGSGTIWRDLAGSSNGTLTNGPTFSSANGGSLVFDGSNDYGNLTYSWPSVFTVNLWLFPISAPADGSGGAAAGGQYSRIVSTGTNDNFEIAINSLNQISYYFSAGGGWRTNIVTLTNNAWTNLTFIINLTNAFIFQNGLQTFTGTRASATGGTSVRIGGRYTNSEHTNIKLSTFQIYNRALTPAEILQNYNATKGRFGLT